jgi:hypothetical protein
VLLHSGSQEVALGRPSMYVHAALDCLVWCSLCMLSMKSYWLLPKACNDQLRTPHGLLLARCRMLCHLCVFSPFNSGLHSWWQRVR